MKKATILLACFSIPAFMVYAQPNATINEFDKEIKTYPFSDPDPIPQPDSYFYPYFRFDGFALESTDRSWKVIELENDYIKVSIFPEIGGKIWGAIEKSTGNEFIYSNSVVKFRDIAMRGPWTSGGIEMNFGIIGHAPTTSAPVDYCFQTKDDGSVSCYLSATDLLTRTRWETEVNLQKDKAFFTTSTTWHSPNPLVQPYYHWMNSAYQAGGDLEFCFPGNSWIGHDGQAHAWPVDEQGRVLSRYRENNFGDSKSYHIVGNAGDYYAAYWHELNFGSGHYAPYGEKLGMKIFLWDQSRAGAIWEDLLTDTDGQYVELQSGRLFNQAVPASTRTPFKHHGFDPYATDIFKEYWFPVLNTGGVVKANPWGVLNVVRTGQDPEIRFCSLQKINDQLLIYCGDSLIREKAVDLDVLETWSERMEVNSPAPLKIVLGNRKMVYSEKTDDNDSKRPLQSPAGFDWESIYGLYVAGQNWMYQRKYDAAMECFLKCIRKEQYYAPALNQLAALYYRKADWMTALDYAQKSLAVNAYDPEANFIYGLINRKTGNYLDAKDGFAVASLSPAFRSAAWIELAKLFLLRDDLVTAGFYAQKVLQTNSTDIEAGKLMAVICRKEQNIRLAQEYISKVRQSVLLNPVVNFEAMLLQDDKSAEKEFRDQIRSELQHETYLEMANWYEDIGCTDEAVRILKMAAPHPLASLRLAYLNSLAGDSARSAEYLEKAVQLSPDFAFPFRTEDKSRLDWAMSRSDNWVLKYYSALLNLSLGNRKVARELFRECDNEPDYPYFYVARTSALRDDPDYDPERDLLKAKTLGEKDWRIAGRLISYYLSCGRPAEALALVKTSIADFPANNTLKYGYAKCLMAVGEYAGAREMLAKTVILPSEGARFGRTTYRQACIMEGIRSCEEGKYNAAIRLAGLARLWPENLGAGKPYDIDERIEDFLEAFCWESKGNKQKAAGLYQKIADFTKKQRPKFNASDCLFLIALHQMGKSDEVAEFKDQWKRSVPDSPLLNWFSFMADRKFDDAAQTEKLINTRPGGTPWDPQYADPEFELVKEFIKLTINKL
ncbi:MAG: DUF5107 domain-containing protein [Mangrovibacterium sp.]